MIVLTGLLVFGINTAVGQDDLAYTSPSDGSDGALAIEAPFGPGVQGGGIAYDPVRKEQVAFGGASRAIDFTPGSNVVGTNRTWVNDGSGWKEIFPTTSPSPRFGHGMVWDPNANGGAGAILLFGGRSSGAEITPETWIFIGDDDNPTWQKLNLATQPLGLRLFAMAYDGTRDEVVLYGGASGTSVKGDTWVWSGSAWTAKNPVNKPFPGWGFEMAYDAARGKMVLFGGRNNNGAQLVNETYTWDGTNWTQLAPANRPPARTGHFMAYDTEADRVVVYGGTSNNQNGKLSDTWTWDGTTWTQLALNLEPPPRYFGDATFDTDRKEMVIYGGELAETDSSNNFITAADVWTFDGAAWSPVSASSFVIDMAEKPDGIWNYTTIDIAAGVVVSFAKNPANTPVIWLASGAVNIQGTVRVNGKDAVHNTRFPGEGGPGGYRGGTGAVNQSISGSYAGEAGLGPGGGLQGIERNSFAFAGQYATTYGSPYVDPLIGGSGGGGGAGNENGDGGGGGGGAGAILIASSRDITVNGSVTAIGGNRSTLNGDGGFGSGGAIVLVADRLLGSGTLDANAFVPTDARRGVIRLEGYERPLADGASPQPIGTVPYTSRSFANLPALSVTSIAGQAVPSVPEGSAEAPDVTFFDAGPVDVVVTAQNIPDGTPVRLRLTGGTEIVELPLDGQSDVTLSSGSATFSTTIPQGLGAVQAMADF
jgi:hypothetical protein